MERNEAVKRFNAISKEHRITIIAYSLEQEIRLIEEEKTQCIKMHKANLVKINERIKSRKMMMKELK